MNQDQQMQLWTSQAIKAMDMGADPLKVNSLLKSLVDRAGFVGVTAPLVPTGTEDEELVNAVRELWSIPSEGQKRAEREYEEAVSIPVIEEAAALPYSPHQAWVQYGIDTFSPEDQAEFYDRAARRDQALPLSEDELRERERERYQAQRGLLETARDSLATGVARTAQGQLRAVPTRFTQDMSDSLKRGIDRRAFDPSIVGEWDPVTGEWSTDNIQRAVAVGGELTGTLLPMGIRGAAGLTGLGLLGLGQGVHAGEALLDSGASPLQASLYGGILGTSFPLLGAVAPAVGTGLLTRAVTGAGLNTGIGIGLEAGLNAVAPEELRTDLLDPWARVPDIVLGGAIGAASRPTPALDITLDPIIDPPIRQSDIRDGAQLDLFGGEPISPERAAARRLEQQIAEEEGIVRPEERQAELEREYAFQQQDRILDRTFHEDIPMGLFSVERPATHQFTHPVEADTAIGAAFERAGLRKRVDEFGNPLYQEPVSVLEPNIFSEPVERPPHQLTFGKEMSRNRPRTDAEPAPSQDTTSAAAEASDSVVQAVKKSEEASLEGQKRRLEEADEIRQLLEKETDPARAARLQQLLEATENGPDLSALPASVASVVNRAPVALQNKLLEGTLTSRDVLDYYADLPGATAEAEREVTGLIGYLRELARSVGGEDVGFTILDNNLHAEVLERNADALSGGYAAFYDPRTNRIYMREGVNSGNTMIHEAAHGITAKMLYSGETRSLSPRAQEAFDDLSSMFNDIFRPELAKRAKGEESLTYGLSNLHEFYSEFFSNAAFRKSLKDMKLEKGWISKLPEGMQIQLRNAKSLYDVAVQGISGLMARAGITRRTIGMEKEATNAYELMFDRMDSLHRSLSPEERAVMRDVSRLNTRQADSDMGFLGEMVEPRFNPALAGADDTPASQAAAAKEWAEKGTKSSFFQRWFGDSKVVDDAGEPVKVYHHGSFAETDDNWTPKGPMHFGTKKAADDRSFEKAREMAYDQVEVIEGDDGGWVWRWDGLTSDDLEAGPFLTEKDALDNGRAYAYRNAVDDFLEPGDLGTISEVYLSIKNPKRVVDHGEFWEGAIQVAKEQGYDGIVYRNQVEDPGSDSWIAFYPEQVKSATDNVGTFSMDQGDIRLRETALPQRPERPPELVKPRSAASTRFRNAVFADGSRKLVSDAKRYVRDQLSGTNYITSTIRNRWFADKNKLAGMEGAIYDVLAAPDKRADSLEVIREKSPEMAATLEDSLERIRGNSHTLADLVEQIPNATPEMIELANTYRERADNYLFRGYEARDPMLKQSYINRLLEQRERGVPEAVDRWNKASRYVSARWLPSITELASISGGRLDQLYRVHTGTDVPSGMSAVQKRLAISDVIDAIEDRPQWINNQLMNILNGDDSYMGRAYDALRDRGGLGTTVEDVPAPIAALLGEVDDPILNLMQTIQNQERQIAHLESSRALREEGIKEGYFTERPDTSTHTHRIEDPRHSFLEGLYTTEDIHNALTQSPDIPMWLKRIGDILTAPARVNKVTTILGNVSNVVKDGVGAAAMALNNGVVNPNQYVRGAKAAWTMVGSHMRRTTPSADAEWAMRSGLMEYAQTPELQRRARGIDERDYQRLGSLIEEASLREDPIGYIQEAVNRAGGSLANAWDVYNSIYSLSELIPKLASAFNERDFWARARPDWSPRQLDRFVLERIRNTTLTPSNVSPILKFTDNVGASFVARYIATMHKNSIYALGYGLKDMATGVKEGDAGIFTHGMKRTVGSITATTILPMWLYSQFGTDGERQEYLDSSDITSGVTFRVIEDEDGREYKQDIDRFNAFGPHTQVTYRLVQALAALNDGDKEASDKHLNIAAQNIWGTMSANSVYRKIDRAFRTGAESNIEKAAPEFFDRIKEIASDNGIDVDDVSSMANLSEIVLPKTLENIVAGLSSDASPRVRAMIASGFATPFHVDKEIHRYVGRRFNKELGDAKKPFNSMIRSSMAVDRGKLERAFLKSAEAIVGPYEKVKVAVEAARSQGTTDAELFDRLMKSGLNRKAVAMIMTGEELTVPLMFGNIAGTLTDDVNREADDTIRSRLEERLPAKMDVLSYLYNKYADMTIDDLKKGTYKDAK